MTKPKFNKLMVMLPMMYFARKIDGENPDMVFLLRCCYFSVQFIIALCALYVYLVSRKLASSKFKDMMVYIPAPIVPFAPVDDSAKTKYEQKLFGVHVKDAGQKLLQSTVMGIVLTSGLHFYKGMIVGLAMQSVMGPLNLLENAFASALLFGGSFKATDTPKSRRLFDEKYRDELTKDDEVVDAEGNLIKVKKEKKKETTFEDILLDTWDAGKEADISNLKQEIKKKNANFKTSDKAWTPLMLMAALGADGSDEVIQKLKDSGANPGVADVDGWNALHWACFHGSSSGAKALVKIFDVIKAGLHEVADKEGKTPLQLAKDEGNTEVAKAIEEAIASFEKNTASDEGGLRKRK